jgi:hypothetical protein
MAFDLVAIGFACLLAGPSMLFMAKNKVIAVGAVKEAEWDAKLTPEMLALASYYLFLLGMVLFTMSMLVISLALSIPPPLAVCSSITGAVSILLWMAMFSTSITGIPGICGPPLPARILLIIIGLVLNVNAIMHVIDGDIVGSVWTKFISVYVCSVAIPHLIAFKHRKDSHLSMPAMH